MDYNIIQQVLSCLKKTVSVSNDERRQAEAYLKSVEQKPGYCVCLLAIIHDSNSSDQTKLAAAIVLKNFIKSNWKENFPGSNRIQDDDRNNLKAQIIETMLSTPVTIQNQLSDAIAEIWREDFPEKWPTLIPELVERMAQLGGNPLMIQGVLQTAHTLFKRYRHESRNDDLFSEMKTVIGQFGVPLTALAKHLLSQVTGDQRLNHQASFSIILKSILLVCDIFFSLNCQDLPEFFEDNINDWMSFFRSLLQMEASLFPNNTDALDLVKSQICDNAILYASKYEEEFAPFLGNFVTDIWQLLLNAASQTSCDALVSNAIEFLSAVIAKPQHRTMFENSETLQQLCEKVIIPNMQFRDSDQELFNHSPDEYLRLDLEGSASHTRRQSACCLVHALCQAFEGPVVTNFSAYIDHLLSEYTNSPNGSAWLSKDAALLLVASVASRGKTEKHGVTLSTKLVDILTFYQAHVLPELQNPDVNHLPVIKADCVRYAIAFRSLLPQPVAIELINLAPKLLTASHPVVHSYAAVMIDKLLVMTRPGSADLEPLLLDLFVDRFSSSMIASTHAHSIVKTSITNAQAMVEHLVQLLSVQDWSDNIYVIRAIMRAVCCLQELCLPMMPALVTSLIACFSRVIKNPTKPSFNHYLFETLCLCIRLTCEADNAAIQHFETALFPIFQEVLQSDLSSFVPYVFQLVSVMLEQYPISTNGGCNNGVNGAPASPLEPPASYTALLPRLLVTSLWDHASNVSALTRLLQAYLLHDMKDIVAGGKISSIFGVFQRLVTSTVHEVNAFALLHVLLITLPQETLQQFIRQVFMDIFRRLQTNKTDKFMRAFACFLARFVLVYSPDALVALVDGIQDGLFTRVLEKVLIAFAETAISCPPIVNPQSSSIVLSRQHWRQVGVGLVRLLGECSALYPSSSSQQQPRYFSYWPGLVNATLAGLVAGPGRTGEPASMEPSNASRASLRPDERFIDADVDASSRSANQQLTFAVQHLPELGAQLSDPRIYLAQTLARLSSLRPGTAPNQLGSVLPAECADRLQAYLNQAQVSLS